MTARHEIRVGNRRLGRGRASPIDATPAPRVGETLQAAREGRGIDIYRAERDTKIRVKYLAALEDSDFKSLPGAVYTKGFLRNYAVYLGLDADEVVARWKDEMMGARTVEAPVPVAPPRPLQAPRRGVTLTPGLLVAVLLTIGVLAFLGYLGFQLIRFAQPPALAVTEPRDRVTQTDTDRIRLGGTSAPLATVKITGGAEQSWVVKADAEGRWSQEVPVTKGDNDFTVTALDPDTSKESPPELVRIVVPLAVPSASAPAASIVAAARLEVSQPADGATVSGGAVTVAGASDAERVVAAAEYLGPATPSGGQPTAGPSPAVPAAKSLAIRDGRFSDTLDLAPGRWRLTIKAEGAGKTPTELTRTVTVTPIEGVQLVVAARGGSAWIMVWVDGRVAPGYAGGQVLRAGTSREFTATRSVTVRTGNSGATSFTLNGKSLGSLGRSGVIETWLFQPPQPPRKTG